MLKRNLIVIAIIAFGLVMAGNTFGQESGKVRRTNINRGGQPKGMNKHDLTEQLSIISPHDAATGKTESQSNAKTRRPNAGFMDYTDDACDCVKATQIKSPRDVASGQATGRRVKTPTRKGIMAEDDWEAPVKGVTGRATGKRQHKPF